ncbi:hypothetical protein QFZ22_000660 [Streptomyces canus]|uniref:Tat pathway signal sequence domain protein n=1 Tax=Streptomyces canus TaxID=58343 RepID=A0AAW8F5Z5_9ACTN|nr:hypothetical protein [Streptomyces canus]
MTITRKVAVAAATAAIGLGTVVTGASGVVSVAQSSDTTVEAQSGRPRPVPPTEPRGLGRSGVERPDQAITPHTGPR